MLLILCIIFFVWSSLSKHRRESHSSTTSAIQGLHSSRSTPTSFQDELFHHRGRFQCFKSFLQHFSTHPDFQNYGKSKSWHSKQYNPLIAEIFNSYLERGQEEKKSIPHPQYLLRHHSCSTAEVVPGMPLLLFLRGVNQSIQIPYTRRDPR